MLVAPARFIYLSSMAAAPFWQNQVMLLRRTPALGILGTYISDRCASERRKRSRTVLERDTKLTNSESTTVALSSPNNHMQRAGTHKVQTRGRLGAVDIRGDRARLASRPVADVGR